MYMVHCTCKCTDFPTFPPSFLPLSSPHLFPFLPTSLSVSVSLSHPPSPPPSTNLEGCSCAAVQPRAVLLWGGHDLPCSRPDQRAHADPAQLWGCEYTCIVHSVTETRQCKATTPEDVQLRFPEKKTSGTQIHGILHTVQMCTCTCTYSCIWNCHLTSSMHIYMHRYAVLVAVNTSECHMYMYMYVHMAPHFSFPLTNIIFFSCSVPLPNPSSPSHSPSTSLLLPVCLPPSLH